MRYIPRLRRRGSVSLRRSRYFRSFKVDGYFAYDKALRKDETVYCIVLKEKGLSYERDKRTAKRKIIQRVALTIAFALLGYLIKVIISAIIA